MSFSITDIFTSLLGNIILQDILALATFFGGYIALKQIIQNWHQQINEKNSNYANGKSIEIIEKKVSKDKKIIVLLGILIIALIGLILNLAWNNFQYTEEQKTIQEDKKIKEDAELVSKSIVISGWESPGDYIGYLTQIVGFYKRHETRFSSEYETYSNQLTFWQDYWNRVREENKVLSVPDKDDLEGLVKSGRDHLQSIAYQSKTEETTPHDFPDSQPKYIWIFVILSACCSIILVIFGPGNKERVEKITGIYKSAKNKFIISINSSKEKNISTSKSVDKSNDSDHIDMQTSIKEKNENSQNKETIFKDKTEIQDIKTINRDGHPQAFKDIYQFAKSDMHKTDYDAENFSIKWINEFADKNFQIFKDVFQFAKSDMYKTDYDAENFSIKWINEFADKNFQIFKDDFQFAKSDMHKTDYDAEKFAFHPLKKK